MSNHLEIFDFNDRLLDEYYVFDWRWWFRCKVKILVVTDWTGSFDTSASFGLGRVLDEIKADEWPHVVFDFTTAHRESNAANFTNFRFDSHDLTQYHQIWLFGVRRAGFELDQSEVRAIAEFMDNGGGVFATGDHEDLGVSMCAEVPRVRSMRRWYWPDPGPNGEPVAPDQTGSDRLDTIVDTNPGVAGVQGSQTDEVPQVITPRMSSAFYPGGFLGRVVKYPHPVLCGPNGPITHLPDHMHEGFVEVPSDLSSTYTFDGYSTTEFPTVGGHQEKPKVIADAYNNVTGDEFGVLGAYDGHKVGIGRVVVDATWHHWFNINMNPYRNAATPGHPTYDPAVVPKWEEMKAYFRNVAAWLSPASVQSCLRNGGWLFALGYADVVITHRSIERVRDSLNYYWQLGVFARDALGRLASQCQTLEWIFDELEVLPFRVPWDARPPFPLPDPPPFMEIDDMVAVALGGAIHALGDVVEDRSRDIMGKLLESDEEVQAIARRGASRALQDLAERYRESCDWFEGAGGAEQLS